MYTRTLLNKEQTSSEILHFTTKCLIKCHFLQICYLELCSRRSRQLRTYIQKYRNLGGTWRDQSRRHELRSWNRGGCCWI
uniref:Uncharacterized protein n=1 Tax=Arabidopsis thaliana TaxID=3702 RepID=Q8GZ78_ARATH|nr:unknown protein [Arabidopsis thaliana]